jgi:hypothetical protein
MKQDFVMVNLLFLRKNTMSFAGHVLDMIQRSRNNSALLESKKARRRKIKEAFANSGAKNSLYENDIKLNKVEWKQYKKDLKIMLKQQRENKIYLIFLLISIIIVVGGFFAWLLFL